MNGNEARRFSGAEKARFVFLAAMLLAIAGMLWALRKEALPPEEGPAPPPAAALPEAAVPAAADEPPMAGPMDPDPVEPYGWNRAETLAGIKDGSDAPAPAALAYLIHTVRATPAGDKARAAAPRVTARELRERGENLRGAWVEAIGAVYAGFHAPEPIPWSGPTGVYRIYASYLFDAEGGAIKVYTVRDEPSFAPGDLAAARGLYLQTQAYRNAAGERASAPVVVAERLTRFAPPPRESWLTSYCIPGALALAALALLRAGLRPGARPARAGKEP
ncbi:MAG TPA: hypothetical protein PKX48_13635 [Planctomycetota bacterium]|jgi:hypothetical protein|nr:hypothetical protein [Planctomycetota bacterium]OQC21752.1 MAG: hypothetical protein BWX69_00682 [Planctomycetes bacterium ADurb.Bin069]HNS00097.1 hypothetical protein [Planctomycetota bacterium]HNU26389.1 hypothetical protein [Planctomycetota bacterium]HOE29722.1 hypothetical protein [Planctomycetota bacterium]